ncbi:MAG: ComEC/Rec2 family competence protein [Planctomycetota bacterium]|nr:ComEC/Rec2 family competence protein [Planctomycetota bacterium]
MLTGFWKIPAVPRSLTCAAMLIVGVRLAEAWAAHGLPIPTVVAASEAFLSLLATTVLHRRRSVRLEMTTLLVATISLGVMLWTVRSRVDDGVDISLLAGTAEFRDDPALRIVGDVANIPALDMPADAASMTGQPDSPRTLLLLNTKALLRGEEPIRVRGILRVLIDGDATERMSWGDRIQWTGQIDLPEPTKNPGEFDFARHMQRHGMSAMAFARHPAATIVIQPASDWNPKRWFNTFRQQTVLLLRDNLKTKNRATAEALLLGNRGHLTPDMERDFIASGTMHLLAISGLHVGILFVFLVRLQNLLLVPRIRSLLLAGLVCVFYALLTDLRPSVMRATGFILLYVLAQALYRDIRMGSLIGTTAMLLIVLNPSIAFDVGAWLSFLAVSALGWVSEHNPQPEDRPAPPDAITWQERLRAAAARYRDWLWLNYHRMLAITLLTAPLVATQFHVVSLVGMVINILLIPLTAVTLICGYIAIFIGLFVPPLASIAASPFDSMLWLLQSCVSLAADIRIGFVMIPNLPFWFIPVYYSLLALSVTAQHSVVRRGFRISLLVFVIFVFRLVCKVPDHHGVTCSVLAVGHGNAVVVQTPDNRVLLFDAGAMHRGERTADTVSRFLWNRGHRMIDAIVISHPDLDHYNAVASLLERMPVGRVLLTEEFVRTESPAVRRVLDALAKLRLPVSILTNSDSAACGDLNIEFLKAVAEPESGFSHNEASVAAILKYRGRRICLPGDLEGNGLTRLLPELPRCEVLMSPHHGSLNSNIPALAATVRPAHVIVSARNDRHRTQLAKVFGSASILHTSTDGCVTIHISPDGELDVDHFRGKPGSSQRGRD